jgi:hypothetical protein
MGGQIASFFLAHGGQQIFETAYPLIKSIPLEEDRFDIEPEITAKLARAGCRIYEVGVSYSGRTYAEGKKINWKDGVRAFTRSLSIIWSDAALKRTCGAKISGALGESQFAIKS